MQKKIFILLVALAFSVHSYPEQKISFITVGDWGAKGIDLQKNVCGQMAQWAEWNNVKFMISLGDNFYDNGVQSTGDPQWQTTFEDIYYQQSLKVPWYAALGNHDYHGNVQAEIDYTKISDRWKMPSRFYSFTYKIDDTTNALFVIMDTSPLALSDEESKIYEDDVYKFDNTIQIKWLDSTLSASNAQWKFVCGHHPVYSGGYHGGQKEMQTLIKPILEKNNVQVYFCGHDHDMQHLKSGKVNYIISGAGANPRACENTKYTLFYKGNTGGFFGVTLTPDFLYGAFINFDGEEIYKVEIPR